MRGLGLAYVARDQVEAQLASGTLLSVLDDWSVSIAGDFLYYPSRRHLAPGLRVLIDALKKRS